MTNKSLKQIITTGLLAACCYVAFTFIQIKIPVGDAYTSIHFGNAFNALAALIVGPVYGGLAGAIGMGIGDILDPVYITSAPKTIILKFMIGFITGTVAHKVFKLSKYKDNKALSMKYALLSCCAGLGFNIIFDPLFSYIYKRFILGNKEVALMLAAFGSMSTIINAITSIIIATLIYGAICKYFNYSKYEK